MALDFQNAKLPRLLPLEASYAENEVEADLKRLFLDLFSAKLSADSFDANVLGVAHLGSFDLVRKAVNMDGLVLLQGDREEAATRYLYRAWNSRNVQGRGIHFLRTYLQMLFPNLCEVEQLWQDKSLPYPQSLCAVKPRVSYWLYGVGEPGLRLNGLWKIGASRPIADYGAAASRVPDTSGMFLTGRIDIALDFSVNVRSIASLMHIIRSIIPARLLPMFRFMLSYELYVKALLSSQLLMQKNARVRYPWCGRVITDSDDARWKLGIDGAPAKLPKPFGSFKIGKLLGGKTEWWLTNCRATSSAMMESHADAWAWRTETLPPDAALEYFIAPPPMKLAGAVRRLVSPTAIGAWKLGAENKIKDLLPFKLNGSRALRARKMSIYPRLGGFKITDYKLPALLPPRPSRLTLSGRWKLGGARNPGFELNVFKV